MTMTLKQRMLVETTARRDEAEALLRSLLDAKSSSEKNLAQLGQADLMKKVTGRSSLDNAIASTQRLVESFNRVLGGLRDNLEEGDLELLAEIEAEDAFRVGV